MVLGAGLVSVAIRLAPEVWLRGRAPPPLVRDALAWLPVVVAGTFVGVLHAGAAAEVRPGYLVAGVAAMATLAWRRTFYVPIVVGAVVLAGLRATGWAA